MKMIDEILDQIYMIYLETKCISLHRETYCASFTTL